MSRRLVIEADGGSRGNPGPAGYGAVVRDGATGKVLAERAGYLGHVTNNVAEYNGLLAGIEAARPEALIWALERGSRSGRVAQQFARDYVGRQHG